MGVIWVGDNLKLTVPSTTVAGGFYTDSFIVDLEIIKSLNIVGLYAFMYKK